MELPEAAWTTVNATISLIAVLLSAWLASRATLRSARLSADLEAKADETSGRREAVAGLVGAVADYIAARRVSGGSSDQWAACRKGWTGVAVLVRPDELPIDYVAQALVQAAGQSDSEVGRALITACQTALHSWARGVDAWEAWDTFTADVDKVEGVSIQEYRDLLRDKFGRS